MAIGEVRLKTGRSIQQEENVIPGQFGSGVAKALGNLGAAVGDVATLTAGLHEREQKTEEFDTRKRFIEYEGEQGRVLAESHQAQPPGAAGITNLTDEGIKLNNAAFLETIPKRLQAQYGPLLTSLEQKQIDSSFAFEYEQGNKLFRQDIMTLTDGQKIEVRRGTVDLATAKDNVLGALALSDLPKFEQEVLAQEIEQELALASYAHEVDKGQATDMPVRKVTLGESSPDVVLSGTGPEARGLSNTIAKVESGGRYDIRYDGSASGATFEDFSDHPRVYVKLANGQRSSAAGKYMFTAETWDEVAADLELTDFSPANQDKAAWHLAQKRFDKMSLPGGPTLSESLLSGDQDILAWVKRSLEPTWVGLSTLSLAEFTESLQGTDPVVAGVDVANTTPGILNGAVGTPATPDVWNDPAYASLTYEQKARLHADGVTATKKAKTAADKARGVQHTAEYNTAVMGASEGSIGLAEEVELKETGVLSTFTEVKAYRAAVKSWKSQVSSTTALREKFSNPAHIFTGSEDAAWNNFLGEVGKEALGAMDQGYLNTALTPLVQRIGYVPSDSAKVLETMVAAGNPNQRTFALEALSSYHAQNPQMLERTTGLSDGMKKEVGWYTAMKPFYSETEIAERVKLRRDPAYVKQHQELITAGLKESRTNVTNADMLDALDSRLVGFDPEMPLTPQQQFVLRKEWDMLYAEGWAMSPDNDVALEYAAGQLQRQWSISDIGGTSRVMRNPPQTYYPTINESHSWIDYTTRRDLGLSSTEEFSLVADGQTRQEANVFQKTGEGSNASYMVGVKDSEGNYAIKLDGTGLPLRIAFDPDDEQLVEGRNWVVSHKNLLGRIAVVEDELTAQWGVGSERKAARKILREELTQLRTSATSMRKDRPEGLNEDGISRQLLTDMEEEAQELWTLAEGDVTIKDPEFKSYRAIRIEYYNQLVDDIKQLGGKVPGEVEDK